MKIKHKTVKNPRQFPYEQYTSKVGRHKFEADLFEDNMGQLIASIGGDTIICRSDAELEDWLDQAMELSEFYHYLVGFLKEVKYVHNEKK